MTRNYTNSAPPVALTVAATDTDTTLTVASTTGYPDVPFTLGLERGTANEEVVLCTAKTVTEFTVTRGYDGSTARTHAIGSSVEHTTAAVDYTEAMAHREASSGVHGITGAVVGTTDTQTLSGKTIDGGSNTLQNLPAGAVTSGVFDIARIPAIPWSTGISGKPSTFTPAAHTHAPGDIVGAINATTIGGRTIYVQSTAPSGASDGDIWFQPA